jgi:fimbrial chaperone protein
MKTRLKSLMVAVAFCIGVTAVAAVAAEGPQLGISGTKVVLAPKEKASSIKLRGGATAPVSFQVRAFRWEQDGDDDILTPTTDLTVSPPLGTVAPGKSQTVRIVLRNDDRSREQAYRILIDEVPSPSPQAEPSPSNIAVKFRMSVPVFAQTRQASLPDLRWSMTEERGVHFITAANRGTRHAAVPFVSARLPSGETLQVRPQGLPYILGGATRRWRVIPPAAGLKPGDTLRVSAQVDGAASEREVTVSGGP